MSIIGTTMSDFYSKVTIFFVIISLYLALEIKSPGDMEFEVAEGGRLWYFAYGSNMNKNRMEQRLAGCSEPIYTRRELVKLKGYELTFNKKSAAKNGTSYANIQPTRIPNNEPVVYGIVYDLLPDAFSKLDGYEGFPDHYTKNVITVEHVATGARLPTVVYLANHADIDTIGNFRPTSEYLGHLLAGADLLPNEYVDFLRTFEVFDDPAWSRNTGRFTLEDVQTWKDFVNWFGNYEKTDNRGKWRLHDNLKQIGITSVDDVRAALEGTATQTLVKQLDKVQRYVPYTKLLARLKQFVENNVRFSS